MLRNFRDFVKSMAETFPYRKIYLRDTFERDVQRILLHSAEGTAAELGIPWEFRGTHDFSQLRSAF